MRLIDADELLNNIAISYLTKAERRLLSIKIRHAPTVEIPVALYDCFCSGIKYGYNQALSEHQGILTFNREELEKALAYWYAHIEVGNEEQNEAAWCAINTIKYCIEHDSGYQEDK